MAGTVGPSTWWLKSKEAADYYARICPVGTILGDGSAVYCRAGGLAWIISPISTQVSSSWAGGQYNTTCVGNSKTICCICEWPALCTRLINCGFNPCDWFIGNSTVVDTMWNCRNNFSYTGNIYWSSTENGSLLAFGADFNYSDQSYIGYIRYKTDCSIARAIRCINL